MQYSKSSTSVVDLQLREEPACVKNVPREVPESHSWHPSGSGDGAHRFSGQRPSGSWGGRGGREEVPLSLRRALFVLTEGH